MDQLTIGFITIIIVFMTMKFFVERYLYKRSIYEAFYSGFTEYRMRKKSIEGMSESYTLKELFGAHRILYQVKRNAKNDVYAYATLFLSSGCYVTVVRKNGKVSGSEVRSFIMENLSGPLKGTAFNSIAVKPKVLVLRTEVDAKKASFKEGQNSPHVSKKNLLQKIKEMHDTASSQLSKAEIDGMFYSIAQASIDEEKQSEMAFN